MTTCPTPLAARRAPTALNGALNQRRSIFALENVVLQPHVGSATHQTRKAMGQLVLDNVAAWVAGRPLVTVVT